MAGSNLRKTLWFLVSFSRNATASRSVRPFPRTPRSLTTHPLLNVTSSGLRTSLTVWNSCPDGRPAPIFDPKSFSLGSICFTMRTGSLNT